MFAAPIESLADDARGAPELLDARRSLQRVQSVLEHLPLEQRAAFILFEIEGESCERIAAIWDVPIGTIYSRLHRSAKGHRTARSRRRPSTRGRARCSAIPC